MRVRAAEPVSATLLRSADYLKAQAIQDRAPTQTEAAADLVRETGQADPAKLREVCAQMAMLQYLDIMAEHGDHLAREALNRNPAKLITLINACSNMSNANIAIQEHKWRVADSSRLPTAALPMTPDDSRQCTLETGPIGNNRSLSGAIGSETTFPPPSHRSNP